MCSFTGRRWSMRLWVSPWFFWRTATTQSTWWSRITWPRDSSGSITRSATMWRWNSHRRIICCPGSGGSGRSNTLRGTFEVQFRGSTTVRSVGQDAEDRWQWQGCREGRVSEETKGGKSWKMRTKRNLFAVNGTFVRRKEPSFLICCWEGSG